VLKVQSTGEGELVDLIDEFSDGKIQFAFVKVTDPNTTLPKYVLVAWCGEGVPERTKGYFTSHLAAVSKVLHGFHVQITARSDRDLTPEGIIQKVADASGSKYSAGISSTSANSQRAVASSKPAFTPTVNKRGVGGFNPLGNSGIKSTSPKDNDVDEDGWGKDAPPVTRTQLEKVPSSYEPTKVNIRELAAQKAEVSKFNGSRPDESVGERDIVKGGYQPVGRVDIAALRRQAQDGGTSQDDRPTAVKGSYQPVGKVDIAAIRARAQKPGEETGAGSGSISTAPMNEKSYRGDRDANQILGIGRSAPSQPSERLTSLPKPKVGKGFGPGAAGLTGTKAPIPGGFGSPPLKTPVGPPVGVGRTFADQGGKTPAQLWAEKKARERGVTEGNDGISQSVTVAPKSPIGLQKSGGADWRSKHEGKSWAPVQTSRTGQSQGSINHEQTDDDDPKDAATSPAGGVSAIRDRFKDASPMGGTYHGGDLSATNPPPLDISSKPNAGGRVSAPGLPSRPPQSHEREEEVEEQDIPRLPTPPPQPPRSPTPPTPPTLDHGSPIRIAMPVGRGREPDVEDAREEQFAPPPAMPARSLAQVVPEEEELTEEPLDHDPARGAGQAVAAASFGDDVVNSIQPRAHQNGRRALVQYDYEKAEDNELELKEGEYVINIEMVDDDWWMGQNVHGESGLFPSNYVELIEEADDKGANEDHPSGPPDAPRQGAIATALYDYEAAESNELSFPENAKITNVEFPDEDWWSGEYGGQQGLFPANYVRLDE
jgi:hypothetical protein